MSSQNPRITENPPLTNTVTDNNPKSPAGSPVVSGEAGTSDGTAEKLLPQPESSPLPLPGMEHLFPPPPLPYELDNSSESLTGKRKDSLVSQLLEALEPLRNDYKKRGLPESHHLEILRQFDDANGFGVGACLNLFPSGEMTGGTYAMGPRNRVARKAAAKVISKCFTKQARKNIRRAVECNPDLFVLLVTLTFDPKLAQLDADGRVNQVWGKKELTRLLNTVKKKYDRMAERTVKEHWRLEYIWVAEIQEKNTKNIHFHILMNRPFIPVSYLVSVWGQAANSVNVKKLKNPTHAVNYLLKYMGKGSSTIEGKRYGMTQKLQERSQPTRIRFEGRTKRKAFLRILGDSFTDISQSGGYAMDWGFAIPSPERKRFKGKAASSDARKVARELLQRIKAEMASIDATTQHLDDLDELNQEREAIMSADSGDYEASDMEFDFGGEE